MAADLEMHYDATVEEIARTLIAEHHEHLQELTFLYLHTTQEKKVRGRVVYAEVKRLGVIDRFLSSGTEASLEAGADFMIVTYGDAWSLLAPNQKQAAIDHELCSVRKEEKPKRDGEVIITWKIVGPDAVVFYGEIERHGLWRRELRNLGAKMRQMPLAWDKVPMEMEPEPETERETVGAGR